MGNPFGGLELLLTGFRVLGSGPHGFRGSGFWMAVERNIHTGGRNEGYSMHGMIVASSSVASCFLVVAQLPVSNLKLEAPKPWFRV